MYVQYTRGGFALALQLRPIGGNVASSAHSIISIRHDLNAFHDHASPLHKCVPMVDRSVEGPLDGGGGGDGGANACIHLNGGFFGSALVRRTFRVSSRVPR